ncbi:hypothetical protein AAZV13_08G000966 [Glycine max]
MESLVHKKKQLLTSSLLQGKTVSFVFFCYCSWYLSLMWSYSDYQPLSPQLFWLELEMDHGMMQHFDDNITQRLFDNFQSFALAALMEIPIQYRITQNLQIANENPTSYQHKRPLPSSCSRISMLLTESTCKECGVTLSSCPMCRQEITTRLRLYT